MPLPAIERPSEESPNELPAVATWVRDGIAVPLAALRAALEELTRELRASGASLETVDGALDEVERVSRSVDELLHWSCEPRPHALRCEVAEIAWGARAGLRPEHRARTLVALTVADDETLAVDGFLLSGALRRLAEKALGGGAERVLIAARRDDHALLFTVVHPTCDEPLDLARSISERDVELAGGTLSTSHTALGDSCHTVRVPTTSADPRSV